MLAIIDIALPDIDGTQLIKKIKSGFPKVRKIMPTGYASVDNAIRALNHGADAFLIKPAEVLLETIDEQLKGQQHDVMQIQQKLDYFTNKLYEKEEYVLVDIFYKVDLE